MSTAELKNSLHKLTVETNEEVVLQMVLEYFNLLTKSRNAGVWSSLSKSEKDSIELGIAQLQEGRSVDHNSVMQGVQDILNRYKEDGE